MSYTAHIRKSDNCRQSVTEHLNQTAKRAFEYGKAVEMASFAQLQGILHDMGKFTERFNRYINNEGNEKRGDIDHSYAGARYISQLARGFDENQYPNIINTADLIARTIISHHGLHDWLKGNGEDYFKERISKNEEYQEIVKNFESEIGRERVEKLLILAEKEYTLARKKIYEISNRSKRLFGFYLGFLERFMQSVLIDADRVDTGDFMSDTATEKEVNLEALWELMHCNMEKKLSAFADKTDKISLIRGDISKRCADFANHKVGICRLVVPTGGGKTLSSLRFAIEYCRNYSHMQKIIYTAPFMSILDQNSDEIASVAGEENFLVHHSDFVADIETEEELAEYELHTEKWDLPVISTTMVQLLNSLFSSKTACVRRMHRLSNSVIIIDEGQFLPIKCVNIFNTAINFLSAICGATVILCTATQPDYEKEVMPVMFDELRDMTGDFTEDFKALKRTELINAERKGGYSFQETAEFCYEKYREAGSLLLIVNTKKSAFEIYNKMCEIDEAEGQQTEIIHLSTNMCPAHRKTVIEKMRAMLSEDKPVICVATQLIEAGVDISFNCVVRSMAGLDNVAQAAGRCNRNGKISRICPVYMININEENLRGLYQVKEAQTVTRSVCNSQNNKDLLAPETMTAYFTKLYHEKNNNVKGIEMLSYPVEDGGVSTTLFELLSLNEHRWKIRKDNRLIFCSQAFKTAGVFFNVIDSDTVGIIVPYDETAEKLIAELNGSLEPDKVTALLRKAQKYTVNLYVDSLKRGETERGVYTLNAGVLALKKEFYSHKCGICYNDSIPQSLIY